MAGRQRRAIALADVAAGSAARAKRTGTQPGRLGPGTDRGGHLLRLSRGRVHCSVMIEQLDLGVIRDFATALLIGALIGVEREKRKGDGEPGIGGLRTFILFALVGAVGGFLSRGSGVPWVLMATLLPVAGLVFAGYWLVTRAQPGSFGLTTEIAAVAVCLLGAMTMLGHRELAIGLGVVTAAVLAYKQPLHGLVAKLGWDDVYRRRPAADRHASSSCRCCRTAPSTPGRPSTPTSSGCW